MSQSPLPAPTIPPPVPTGVDLSNVQGDVILGFPKRKEEFVFFMISEPAGFKSALPKLKITSTADVIQSQGAIAEARAADPTCLIPLSFLNIAFSQRGLHKIDVNDDIGDFAFAEGQLHQAEILGDDGVKTSTGFDPHWEPAFKDGVDGVLLIAGDSWKSVNATVAAALHTLGTSVKVVYRLKGSVRPGEEKGKEHFGWEDGISNPAVKGIVTNPLPGQRVIRPGFILLGREADPVPTRPAWAVEGSFLAFRQLQQLVPEFHKFLTENPIVLPGLSREKGSELLGARLVGRWKSGAPIQLAPLADDPVLAKDKQRNNHFVYPQAPGDAGQTACPFAAHVRKTNPRNDLDFFPGDPVESLSITRSGIPYGPEVTFDESEESVTEHARGLAFVSYQSALRISDPVEPNRGFHFIQQTWANNVDFPFRKEVVPGFDPIIGQANGARRGTLGTAMGVQMSLPRNFVVSRGGEYFFSPSIHALKTTFAGVNA
ncbi:Dyp-type peroxidase [Ceratobasidium sp. AG-I]|nr:Dyp-type peroxidase [Ceratobasidium sp. AG-I]